MENGKWWQLWQLHRSRRMCSIFYNIYYMKRLFVSNLFNRIFENNTNDKTVVQTNDKRIVFNFKFNYKFNLYVNIFIYIFHNLIMEINELLVYLRNFTFGQFGSERLTLFVDIIFASVLALCWNGRKLLWKPLRCDRNKNRRGCCTRSLSQATLCDMINGKRTRKLTTLSHGDSMSFCTSDSPTN